MTADNREYDAVVVGSGAGGGIAAYVLTQRGVTVLLLEAGRSYDPALETPMFQVEADAPLNGASTPDKPLGFYDASIYYGTEIPGEPYAVAAGTAYRWDRTRMLGGRTNHWGRVCGRYGPYDFRTHSRVGWGYDWPLDYENLAPYYDKVERLIGVFGAAEGIENSPDSPPGVLQPPPPMRTAELWVSMVLQKRFAIRTVPNHVAILTRPLHGRPACVYATPCERGCSIKANFQSTTVLLPPALATGRLRIRTHAMAYEVLLNSRGRATGVHYIDTLTGARHFVRSRSVVLAASTAETARILLNSRSASFPQGLANDSGEVGRNLTDSVTVVASAEIPTLQGLPAHNDDGAGLHHAMVPWWGHGAQRAGQLPFVSEYNVYPFGGKRMPRVQQFANLPHDAGKPLYGHTLRARLRHDYGSRLTLAVSGGMIPNVDCRCELDASVKDRWGIPVLCFHWKWGEQELALERHAAQTLRDMLSAMGGRNLTMDTSRVTGGKMFSGHELGTARMGSKRTDSVLNGSGHAWDVRNLYIADGAVFAGHACKLPTETLMALAWRASDHLADSFRRKDI